MMGKVADRQGGIFRHYCISSVALYLFCPRLWQSVALSEQYTPSVNVFVISWEDPCVHTLHRCCHVYFSFSDRFIAGTGFFMFV